MWIQTQETQWINLQQVSAIEYDEDEKERTLKLIIDGNGYAWQGEKATELYEQIMSILLTSQL